MLIGVIGPIKSGKSSLIEYLIENEGFKEIRLVDNEEEESKLEFKDIKSLLDYVTNNWQEKLIIETGLLPSTIQVLRKRPFFLLVQVDAPLEYRYKRWLEIGTKNSSDFVNFIIENDAHLYTNHPLSLKDESNQPEVCSLNEVMNYTDVSLFNPYTEKDSYYHHIKILDLLDPERLRPGWDNYFMLLTELASKRSNCMKRRVGCLIVKDHRVIATGYNGTPRNVPNCSEGGCPRCNQNSTMGQGLDLCLCIHAEENALLEAGRERINYGYPILYCNTCPCIGCAKKIVQVGIKEVVYALDYGMDEHTINLFEMADVKLRKFVP
ncbi:deoxycytidylate deaminase, partial [Neoconidiobolus thromboides FSU 785]